MTTNGYRYGKGCNYTAGHRKRRLDEDGLRIRLQPCSSGAMRLSENGLNAACRRGTVRLDTKLYDTEKIGKNVLEVDYKAYQTNQRASAKQAFADVGCGHCRCTVGESGFGK